MTVPATARWVVTAVFGIFAVFSVPTILAPGKGGVALQVMSTAFSGLLVFLAYRSATAGLSIDAKNVTYRAYVRIIRWPTAVVQRFDVRDARVGALSWPRQVVWITLRDGRKHKLEMLNFGPRDQRALEVVAALNAGLLS